MVTEIVLSDRFYRSIGYKQEFFFEVFATGNKRLKNVVMRVHFDSQIF